jgi:hypothetical protein
MADLARGLLLEIEGRRFPVSSLADASAKVSAVIDRMGIGASQFRSPLLRDSAGEVVGYVSYNGRVFAGRPERWTGATAILHDPRAAGC